jgi:hypothetical protein
MSAGVESRVVVELRGGLGNQMFQYAIGRCIADTQARALFLDDLALARDHPRRTKRAYALHIFDIEAGLTSRTEWPEAPVRAVVTQQRRGFHEEVLKPAPFTEIYLKGFWQNAGYFAEVEPRLRRHFRFRPGPWHHSEWTAVIAGAPGAVCVHVRRGDYLDSAGAVFDSPGPRYYARAIEAMRRQVGEPHFFVFSDDLDWCERNLELDHPHSFVRHHGGPQDRTCEDFKLMTLCRHFIIANSSFSWWAAWLGSDPRKIVVAPAAWFRDVPSDSGDITPRPWQRL